MFYVSNIIIFLYCYTENLARVVTDVTEQKKIVQALHEGLGSSDEAAALGGHIGRDKVMGKILER